MNHQSLPFRVMGLVAQKNDELKVIIPESGSQVNFRAGIVMEDTN